MGVGLDMRRPPLPDLQHLLVLVSRVGVWVGTLLPEEQVDELRLSVCSPRQVGQAPGYAAPARVPTGQMQPVQDCVSVIQGPGNSERKEGIHGQHASLHAFGGDPGHLRGH